MLNIYKINAVFLLLKYYKVVIKTLSDGIKLDKSVINIYNSRRCRYGNEKHKRRNALEHKAKN